MSYNDEHYDLSDDEPAGPNAHSHPRALPHHTKSARPQQSTPETPANLTNTNASRRQQDDNNANHGASMNDSEREARDAALHAELESLRRMNQVIEGVITSLDGARGNMATIHSTILSATSLLQTYTRILSQTEHTSRLVLHPSWRGATQDSADAESEAAARVRNKQRQVAEETARREAAEELATRRREAEEERRRGMEAGESGTGAATVARGRGGSVRGRAGMARGGVARAGAAVGARSVSTGAGRAAAGGDAAAGVTGAGRGYVGVGGQAGRGRAATAGYGRVGSVGTGRAGRARGTGTGRGVS